MHLDAALTEIAAFLDLDPLALLRYADEDRLGGYDPEPSRATFPGGSLWEVEGKVLYALVRALKPHMALELGTWHGASATHLLEAVRANGDGYVGSVDMWEGAGKRVPSHLHKHWHITFDEAVHFIQTQVKGRYLPFVFEDCIHSESEVYAIVTALKPKLRPGAVVVHHDSQHGDDGDQIRRALDKAGVNYRSWLIEPSDCGIAIWRAE